MERARRTCASNLTRKAAKQAASGLIHYSGLRHAFVVARRIASGGRRVLILGYHRVVPDIDRELGRSIPGSLVSTRTFRNQLEAIAKAGFQFASITEAIDVLSGKRVAKKDLCVLTFDDVYRDVYRHAFPILKSKGIPATLYLPAAFIGTSRRLDHDRLFHLIRIATAARFNPDAADLPPGIAMLLRSALSVGEPLTADLDDYISEMPSDALTAAVTAFSAQLGQPAEPEWGDLMDWDEARRIAAAGYELGGHTLQHVVLTFEGPCRIEDELRGCKELIERQVGLRARHFSYCNGWYSEQLVRCLSRLGFESGLTTEDLPNRLGDNPFALKRKMLWQNFSTGLFGRYSPALTRCCVDDVFGMLGLGRPVLGKRAQRFAVENHWTLSDRYPTSPSLGGTRSLPCALEGETA